MADPNQTARFVRLPKMWAAEISAANPNRDGTGTVVAFMPAGDAGSRVDHVRVVAEGTTTAGMVRLFLHDGITPFLVKELEVDAVTASATVPAFEIEWVPTTALLLPSGWTLRAATENAETFNVMATGGDY